MLNLDNIDNILKKYNLNFQILKSINISLKNKYEYLNKLSVYGYFILNIDNDESKLSIKSLRRHKFIEKRVYSYVSDIDLYRRIELAYNLWFMLFEGLTIEILWNKETTNCFDYEYKFLKKIVDIYLKETEDIVKDIEKYEGGIKNEEKDTNENVCCNKGKIRKKIFNKSSKK